MRLSFKKITSTGSITTKPALFGGFLLGTDSVNDPEITVADGNGGDEISPTATYDASALGLNGAIEGHLVYCPNGIHVTITCGGTVEVSVRYRDSHLLAGWEG